MKIKNRFQLWTKYQHFILFLIKILYNPTKFFLKIILRNIIYQ